MTAFYIHYPFCRSKCPYCDFNSHVRDSIDYKAFEQAYFKEIEYFANNSVDKNITSIFFGGGTPSLMPVDLVANLINKISQKFTIQNDCEITLEANPTSSEAQKFMSLKKIGINRLSLGIQALNDDDLKFLGREHSSFEAMETIKMVQNLFDNFSFDLIYARPNQTQNSWKQELDKALSFKPKHLSLYQLTIEKGTKFYSQYRDNKFTLPDENLASDLYNMTNQIMSDNDFEHYEISNYAHKNFASRHNLSYWQSDDYIGIGAGAHSRVSFVDLNRYAIQILSEPSQWLNKNLNLGSAIQKISKISRIEMIEEIIMMGLRLENGLSQAIFLKYFNQKFDQILDLKKLNFLIEKKLLIIDEKNIRIPEESRILTNSIIQKICSTIF